MCALKRYLARLLNNKDTIRSCRHEGGFIGDIFAIGIGFTGVALAQDVQGMGSGIKMQSVLVPTPQRL